MGESHGLRVKFDSQLSRFAALAKFLTSPSPICLIYDIAGKTLASTVPLLNYLQSDIVHFQLPSKNRWFSL